MQVNAVSSARLRRRAESAVLWIGMNDLPPHRYLVASCRRAGERIRELHWAQPLNESARWAARSLWWAGEPGGSTQ